MGQTRNRERKEDAASVQAVSAENGTATAAFQFFATAADWNLWQNDGIEVYIDASGGASASLTEDSLTVRCTASDLLRVVGGGAGCLYGRKPCAVGRARGRVITEQRAYRKGARILHAPELCGEGTEKAIRPQEITIFAQKSLTNGAKKVKLKNSQVARHALPPQCLRLCRDV